MIDLNNDNNTGCKYITHQPKFNRYVIQIPRSFLERGDISGVSLNEFGFTRVRATFEECFELLEDIVRVVFNDTVAPITSRMDIESLAAAEAMTSTITLEKSKNFDALTPGQIEAEAFEIGDETNLPRTIQHVVISRDPVQQNKFKLNVKLNFSGVCCISGSDVCLHAAHIQDLCNDGDYRTTNGLLLDATLHAMFDAGLMAINPQTLSVHFRQGIRHPYVELFEGKVMKDGKQQVDRDAIAIKWSRFLDAI